MLAPRKKLWSTPGEVVDKAIELLAPTNADVVYDIGAGDGRFLVRCTETTPAARCIGVEIDEARGKEAENNIDESGVDKERCQLIVGNALEQDYSSGTLFFLYLVPRGLRIILPYLKGLPHKVKVVTYMSPFPEEVKPVETVKVNTTNHAGSEWPLFLYIFGGDGDVSTSIDGADDGAGKIENQS